MVDVTGVLIGETQIRAAGLSPERSCSAFWLLPLFLPAHERQVEIGISVMELLDSAAER